MAHVTSKGFCCHCSTMLRLWTFARHGTHRRCCLRSGPHCLQIFSRWDLVLARCRLKEYHRNWWVMWIERCCLLSTMFHHNFTLKTSSYSWLLFFRLSCNRLYTIVCKLYEYISRGYWVGDGSDRGSWGCFFADLRGGGGQLVIQLYTYLPDVHDWTVINGRLTKDEGEIISAWRIWGMLPHWMYLVMRVTPKLGCHSVTTIGWQSFSEIPCIRSRHP